MKVALIGGTGYVGSQILNEALNRGHQVTALSRHTEKLPQHAQLTALSVDIFDQAKLVEAIRHHDAVIFSFNAFEAGIATANAARKQLDGTTFMMQAAKAANIKRLLIVGGAGSLEIKPAQLLVDNDSFPAEYKEMARAMRDVLAMLKQEKDLDWTFISPSAELQPGQRTGVFRIGKDQLLIGKDGKSRISTQDYAVAMIDEMEHPAYSRQRFTVGY